jgi:predicted RNA binding protein YcfA (HicA-like mRNA interferase family)
MRLPRITSRELVSALKRLGFVEARQTGSHLVLKRDQPPTRVVVPMHAGRVLKLGTFKAILDDARISEEELREVL